MRIGMNLRWPKNRSAPIGPRGGLPANPSPATCESSVFLRRSHAQSMSDATAARKICRRRTLLSHCKIDFAALPELSSCRRIYMNA
jgi:hypothetical protein